MKKSKSLNDGAVDQKAMNDQLKLIDEQTDRIKELEKQLKEAKETIARQQ